MFCNVIHVPALGEQIVNFTKIGIINNLRYSSSCYPDCFRDLLLAPSKAAQTNDNDIPTGPLTGSNYTALSMPNEICDCPGSRYFLDIIRCAFTLNPIIDNQ